MTMSLEIGIAIRTFLHSVAGPFPLREDAIQPDASRYDRFRYLLARLAATQRTGVPP